MTAVSEVLVRLGGTATFADLVAATSRRALARAVRSGDVVRLTRGVYGHPQLSADRSTALAHAGVLSHTSAALAWRLPLLGPPPKPHVTLPTHRKARPGPAAVLHWADLPAIDLRRGLTSLERTVVDCARILPFGEGLAVADAALATGRLTAEELRAAALRSRGRGRANAVRVAAMADPRSESFLESVLRSVAL
ncbi:type IV toxin-antitoxin system AbiEi family antitoxin domain-containing protein [Kribbella sp. NPDC005582]|uniref:type IV toxin-antitoxin system AbiEi family antitoxin domain-containing protein n=1 Tax=Kribbella sp. NPDC005582 TaxID=3156893 RepID=UPI0033BB7BB6